MEPGVDLLGDLPGLPVADDLPVVACDGRDLRCGPGHPDLVRGHEHEPGDRLLDDLVAQVPGDLDDRVPGDSPEDALCERGGDDLPMEVHEDVLSGALGDVSDGVQHDGLVGSLAVGLPLGEGGCDVGPVDLGSGGAAQVVGPLPGGRDELGSGVGVSQVRSHVDAGDDEGRGDSVGVEADLLSAQEDAGLDVVDGIAVGADGVLDGVAEVLFGVGLSVELEVDAHDPAAVHEPLDVVLEPEDGHPLGGVVDPDAFEDPGPVVHRMREDVDLRIGPVDELSVKPDLFRLVHVKHLWNVGRETRSPLTESAQVFPYLRVFRTSV